MALSAVINEVNFSIGDTIDVHQKVVEGEKERIQVFQGIVIAIKGRDEGKSFTVRKIAVGQVGVERIWPLLCPSITKIEVKRKGHVRRSKLYFLRNRKGKNALKVKEEKKLVLKKDARFKKSTDSKAKTGKTRGAAGKKTASK